MTRKEKEGIKVDQTRIFGNGDVLFETKTGEILVLEPENIEVVKDPNKLFQEIEEAEENEQGRMGS